MLGTSVCLPTKEKRANKRKKKTQHPTARRAIWFCFVRLSTPPNPKNKHRASTNTIYSMEDSTSLYRVSAPSQRSYICCLRWRRMYEWNKAAVMSGTNSPWCPPSHLRHHRRISSQNQKTLPGALTEVSVCSLPSTVLSANNFHPPSIAASEFLALNKGNDRPPRLCAVGLTRSSG